MKVQQIKETRIQKQKQKPQFKGLVDTSFRYLATNQAIGANGVDVAFMVIPRTTTDMIGRVIGSGVHTGIYKITEISSGKCYIGQAVNIADRWKQHIKRGLGAEPPTRNKLYPAMIAAGPENFTFEVVEECDRSRLDEREDYWQDFYKAKEFGYSMK